MEGNGKKQNIPLSEQKHLSKAEKNHLLSIFGIPRPWEDRQFFTPVRASKVDTTSVEGQVHDDLGQSGAAESSISSKRCGYMSLLPAEIMHMIVLHLDFPAVVMFCATNSILENYIRSLPCYRLLFENCREALRLMTKMGFHELHTMGDIFAALLDRQCWARCGNVGDRLFLPKCRRCCEACVGRVTGLQAIYVERVAAYFELPEERIESNLFTFVENNQGTCHATNPTKRFHRKLVVGADVISLTGRLYGDMIGGNPRVWHKRPEELSAEMTVRFPFVVDVESYKVEFGRYCRACREGDQGKAGALWRWGDCEDGKIPFPVRVLTNTALLGHILDGECPERKFLKNDDVSIGKLRSLMAKITVPT